MNNMIIRFKRFIGNKNTVSILTMIVGIGVLIIGYNYRVNSKINPVTVPYAKKAEKKFSMVMILLKVVCFTQGI